MVVSFCGRRILLSRCGLLKTPKRNGYIVLVPEIGDDLPRKNPLLKEDKMPEFNSITIEKCIAAIGKQTIEFEESIKAMGQKLEKDENVDLFKDVLNPLEDMYLSLQITWGIAKTLYFGNQSLMPTKSFLSMHERAKKASATKYIVNPIYQACKKLMNNKEVNLDDQQKRVLSRYILEGKLNGLDLSKKLYDKYIYLCHMEIIRSEDFKERLQISINTYSQKVQNPEVVTDFPEEFLKMIAADPTQPHVGPWTVTLNPCIMNTFMAYCPDRVLRWKVWEANATKASMYQEKLLQTSTALEEIRGYRQEKAQLLGYKTYAHSCMETKMAHSVENVYATMDKLLQTAFPAQQREIEELNKFGAERGLQGSLKLWDIPYWRRKQRFSLYNYKEDTLKEYFPLPKVLSGLFNFIETLFDIQIVESSSKPDTWHKDVQFFDIFDLKSSTREPIANFYLDLYARRDEKIRVEQEIGSVVEIKNRSKITGMKPLVALIFNFQPPVNNKPSLLSFEDVKVLFRKFGYMLQQSLTTLDYAEIAGHAYLEWDAEYIMDHFMINWLYEPSVLRSISSHYETEKPLPVEMIDTVRNVRSHLAGFDLCKELYLSRLDLELHSNTQYWGSIMSNIWDNHFVIPQEKKDSHVCSFNTIFSGGWGAAYFSFFWSEMVAADLHAAFQKVHNGDQQQQKQIATRFRDTFLSLAGLYPTNEIFRRFRGRDPSPTALLKNLCLSQSAQGKYNNQKDESSLP